MNKVKRDNNDIYAFIVTAILTIVSFSFAGRMFFSEYMLPESDLLCLNIPFNKLFIEKLFSGGNLYYSFLPAMGMDISSYIAYLSCLCPINLIYLFVTDINLAAIIITIIKISLAAFFFQRFSRKVLDVTGVISVTFSACYGLCGYTTAFFLNTHFLDGLYMLPLIMYLISDLVRYKPYYCLNKISIKLCLSYAYLFICSFYSGYIVGIFSLLYFIILVFVERPEKIKKLVITYFFSVINAVLLSAFILLPASFYILSHNVSDATKLTDFKANLVYMVGNLYFGMFQDRVGDFPYIYSGLATIILAVLFFINKKTDKKIKIILGTLLGFIFLCMVVPFLYLFMHCFDAPDMFYYRFSYMFSFVIISMGIVSFKNIEKCKEIHVIVTIIAVFACFFIVYVNQSRLISEFQSIKGITLKLNILFIILYGVLLILKIQGKSVINIFAAFCFVELLMNSYVVNSKAFVDELSKKDNYEKIEAQLDNAVNDIKISDKGIYRYDLVNAPFANYNLMSDTMTTGMIGTFENENYRKTISSLGMATSPRTVGRYGTGDLIRMLFGEKYIIESYGIKYNQNIEEPLVKVNDYALPLGYMVSEDILNSREDIRFSNNPFKNQNLLLSLMLGENMEYYKMAEPKMDEELAKVKKEGSVLSLEEGCESGYAKYSFESDKPAYLYVPQERSVLLFNYPRLVSKNGDMGAEDMESYVSCPHILTLGLDENNEYTYAFIFNNKMSETSIDCSDIYVATINEDVLERASERLKKEGLDIDEFKDGYISGNIDVNSDYNILFMPVQYDANWRVYVDGEKKAVIPLVNKTFMGCYLDKGSHRVEFKYVNPLQIIGLWITIMDIITMFMMCLITRKSKKKQI